jgi:hypothetical protein
LLKYKRAFEKSLITFWPESTFGFVVSNTLSLMKCFIKKLTKSDGKNENIEMNLQSFESKNLSIEVDHYTKYAFHTLVEGI